MVTMDKAKMLVVGAGILAAMYWYITSQQRVQDDKIDAEFAKFDEQFDRAWSNGPNAEAWKADEKEASERYQKAKKRLEESQKIDDEAFVELGNELDKMKLESE